MAVIEMAKKWPKKEASGGPLATGEGLSTGVQGQPKGPACSSKFGACGKDLPVQAKGYYGKRGLLEHRGCAQGAEYRGMPPEARSKSGIRVTNRESTSRFSTVIQA